MPRSRTRPSTFARGRAAERRVAWHYRLRGYRILARNVRAGGVELDLIVRRGRRLVFCEVKLKEGPRFGAVLFFCAQALRRAPATISPTTRKGKHDGRTDLSQHWRRSSGKADGGDGEID